MFLILLMSHLMFCESFHVELEPKIENHTCHVAILHIKIPQISSSLPNVHDPLGQVLSTLLPVGLEPPN